MQPEPIIDTRYHPSTTPSMYRGGKMTGAAFVRESNRLSRAWEGAAFVTPRAELRTSPRMLAIEAQQAALLAAYRAPAIPRGERPNRDGRTDGASFWRTSALCKRTSLGHAVGMAPKVGATFLYAGKRGTSRWEIVETTDEGAFARKVS